MQLGGSSLLQQAIGFGYVEVEKVGRNTQKALHFVEKPDLSTAQEYLATGRYYWNSGMFCFTSGTLLEGLQEYAPEVISAAKRAWAKATTQDNVTQFDGTTFGLQPDISIDYALLERASNVTLVSAKFSWNDVGSRPAVSDACTADSNGNTLVEDGETVYISVDTADTHIQVQSHGSIRVLHTKMSSSHMGECLIMVNGKTHGHRVADKLYRVRKSVQGKRQGFIQIQGENQFEV